MQLLTPFVLLDPGAGVGCLAAAAVEKLVRSDGVRDIDLIACEIDPSLLPHLQASLIELASWAKSHGARLSWAICQGSYLELGDRKRLQRDLDLGGFDAVIMNPPYRKLGSRSSERVAIEQFGVRVANLYTAFMSLAVLHLRDGGRLAAITPRSFANGLYHEPFRRFFFERVGITRLHLFESRTHVFADADVLQENVVFSAQRSVHPRTVQISISHGINDESRVREVAVEEIIRPEDPQCFLRIPGAQRDTEDAEAMMAMLASLEDLDIAVSTGKVVEFRVRSHLRVTPESGSAPLVRPNHLKGDSVCWPAKNGYKSNALMVDPESEKLLLPNGTYVIVKRLTSKEEVRRVCAAVSDPSAVPGKWIAFENHVNVFHRRNQGLEDDLAQGLTAYLNSSLVDRYVRQFNGHTQVNATDLRHLRYPNTEQLIALGSRALRDRPTTQEQIDGTVASVLSVPTASLRVPA